MLPRSNQGTAWALPQAPPGSSASSQTASSDFWGVLPADKARAHACAAYGLQHTWRSRFRGRDSWTGVAQEFSPRLGLELILLYVSVILSFSIVVRKPWLKELATVLQPFFPGKLTTYAWFFNFFPPIRTPLQLPEDGKVPRSSA